MKKTQNIATLLRQLNIGELRAVEKFAFDLRYDLQKAEDERLRSCLCEKCNQVTVNAEDGETICAECMVGALNI